MFPYLSQRKGPPKNPWWSKELLKEVKLKYAAWKKHKWSGSQEDYHKYVLQRNKTTEAIRHARFSYENSIIMGMKKEPKKLFKYIRSQQRLKPCIGPLEKETGEQTQSDSGQQNYLMISFIVFSLLMNLMSFQSLPVK